MEKFLGKKRETRENDENDDDEVKTKICKSSTNQEEKGKCTDDKDSHESPSDEDSTKGKKPKDEEKNIVVTDQCQTSKIFGSSFATKASAGFSFFSIKPSPLIPPNSSQSSTLFSSKPMLNFSSFAQEKATDDFFSKKPEQKEGGEEEEEEDNSESAEDNDPLQSNSPNPYNPLESRLIHAPAAVSKEQFTFTKKYIKHIENIYIYTKKEGRYVSKGTGFLSLEAADDGNKRIGMVLFRNILGNKIIEGMLNPKLKKFESYIRNLKYIGCASFIQKSSGNFEVCQIKIPFPLENELKDFEREYNAIIEFLSVEKKK